MSGPNDRWKSNRTSRWRAAYRRSVPRLRSGSVARFRIPVPGHRRAGAAVEPEVTPDRVRREHPVFRCRTTAEVGSNNRPTGGEVVHPVAVAVHATNPAAIGSSVPMVAIGKRVAPAPPSNSRIAGRLLLRCVDRAPKGDRIAVATTTSDSEIIARIVLPVAGVITAESEVLRRNRINPPDSTSSSSSIADVVEVVNGIVLDRAVADAAGSVRKWARTGATRMMLLDVPNRAIVPIGSQRHHGWPVTRKSEALLPVPPRGASGPHRTAVPRIDLHPIARPGSVRRIICVTPCPPRIRRMHGVTTARTVGSVVS